MKKSPKKISYSRRAKNKLLLARERHNIKSIRRKAFIKTAKENPGHVMHHFDVTYPWTSAAIKTAGSAWLAVNLPYILMEKIPNAIGSTGRRVGKVFRRPTIIKEGPGTNELANVLDSFRN